MGRMAQTHAVRILYMTTLRSTCLHCECHMAYYTPQHTIMWHCDVAQRWQARQHKQDRSYPTAVYQYPASQGGLCCLISCRCHMLREAKPSTITVDATPGELISRTCTTMLNWIEEILRMQSYVYWLSQESTLPKTGFIENVSAKGNCLCIP